MLRSITSEGFQPVKPLTTTFGIKPKLMWIKLKDLRVDDAYQREVMENGKANVYRIAREFDWSKFGIVIVADLGDGTYAIVDGQHRCLGADLRGVDQVPCSVITADAQQQAEAFAAINGAITAISPLAIYHAELEAKNPQSLALKEAMDAGFVTVSRYQKNAVDLAIGETTAIEACRSAFRYHGPEILSLALRCIVKGSEHGNKGLIRSNVIRAYCHVFDAERKFILKPEFRLISLMKEFDLEAELNDSIMAAKTGASVGQELTIRLFRFLEAELG